MESAELVEDPAEVALVTTRDRRLRNDFVDWKLMAGMTVDSAERVRAALIRSSRLAAV